jgi:hypothetical protein
VLRLPRWFVSSVGLLFIVQPALVGLISYTDYKNLTVLFIAVGIFLGSGIASIFFYREHKMPIWIGILNVAVATSVPALVNSVLELSARGSHATWYVTGIGALMCITAYRRQTLAAWTGLIITLVETLIWGGLDFFWSAGLVGAIGLVAAGHAVSIGLYRAEQQTRDFLATMKDSQSVRAKEVAIRAERSIRTAATMSLARPILEKIAGGVISKQDQQNARLLEAALRDEIRGRNLLNDQLRASILAARVRTVEVVLLDEGGLEDLVSARAEAIRNRLARELNQINQGRVTIRAPRGENHAATFVASRSGTSKPDVWLKL